MDHLPLPPATRRLGRSDIAISPLAWGMWRLTAGNRSGAEIARLVEEVLEAGITLFDTADIYGFSGKDDFGRAEAAFGAVLAANPGLRGRMVISTKGGIRPGVPYDQSRDYLTGAIDASLRRLGVETIDLWQVHRPDILVHPEDLARTLDAAVAAGKIRALGVSNFSQSQVAALQSFLSSPLVVTQPEISPLCIESFENGALDQAMMLGLTPLAWSPLGGGRLLSPETPRAQAVAAALDAVAEAQGVERSVAAYGWLMAHPSGIVPIIGSQDISRIRAAAAALTLRWTRAEWYAVLVAARGAKLP